MRDDYFFGQIIIDVHDGGGGGGSHYNKIM
jgi:hypothetical protein